MFGQWEFQDPEMEVPTIYKAYVSEYPHKICPYMVQYLHFRILEFPLIWPKNKNNLGGMTKRIDTLVEDHPVEPWYLGYSLIV